MGPKKRKPKPVVRHIWRIGVWHRDWEQTVNDRSKALHMKQTYLLIESKQPPTDHASIDLAISRVRAYMRRNSREFSVPNINGIEYRGTLDN